MLRLAEFGFDATLLAGTATAGWFVPRHACRWLVAATVSLVALVTGALLEVRLYPWTDVLVFVFALSSGGMLASLVPARPMPLGLVLATLSAIDIGLFLLPAPSAADSPAHLPTAFFYGNVVLLLPHGRRFVLGALDLLLAVALAAHAKRRALPVLAGTIPPLLGLALAFAVLTLHPTPGLPLIPFFSAGWLAVEIGYRLLAR
ncbi:hypothetical protein OO015_09565 [Thermomicrobium sp. 4228-Ro]|uniref:hypothetical protein n=1 Tax=Thermomicrobium sp. 4228-Ro TaxID=2993937 RepID=UPI0022488E00|nr:hypothetical protein [Thermomicrobium sp. 4228-Ro]MCX2727734.1 hypothetical protein [Thermomicrobium sp. 4228-Ro]